MTPPAGSRSDLESPAAGCQLPRLQAGAIALGVSPSADQLAAFQDYREALLTANQRTNLTAITDPAGVEVLHFVDSLTCLRSWPTAVDQPLRIIDIGAGAGLPGLPLTVMCPALTLDSVDSVGKKTAFLTHLVSTLKLDNVTVINARAEALARDRAHREQYDVALARAVASLPVLLEYTLPFLRVGGRLIAQKTVGKAQSEIAASRLACTVLGGGPPRLFPVALAPMIRGRNHYLEEVQQALAHRVLIVVEKEAPTPNRYPRRPGVPARRPM